MATRKSGRRSAGSRTRRNAATSDPRDAVAQRLKLDIDAIQVMARWLNVTRSTQLTVPARTVANKARSQLKVALEDFSDSVPASDVDAARAVYDSVIVGVDRTALVLTDRCSATARLAERLKYINTLITKYVEGPDSKWGDVLPRVREHLARESHGGAGVATDADVSRRFEALEPEKRQLLLKAVRNEGPVGYRLLGREIRTCQGWFDELHRARFFTKKARRNNPWIVTDDARTAARLFRAQESAS